MIKLKYIYIYIVIIIGHLYTYLYNFLAIILYFTEKLFVALYSPAMQSFMQII